MRGATGSTCGRQHQLLSPRPHPASSLLRCRRRRLQYAHAVAAAQGLEHRHPWRAVERQECGEDA